MGRQDLHNIPGVNVTTSLIKLTGAPNFRDIGGYSVADGRRIKTGRVFRSGDSGNLCAEDIDLLNQLKPQLIVDLRSEKEVAMNEIRWPRAGAEFIAANILADLRAGNKSVMDMLTQNPTPAGASHMMEITYSVLPTVLGPTILHIARRIAEGKCPVVFHCSVGRDRAGMTAAFLLFALGVHRDIVIADYLRTNVHINAAFIREITSAMLLQQGTELDEEALDILTFARIEHFHSAMRTVNIEYGSVEHYLDAIGIDAQLRSAMQQELLTES
jgi:protein-tyrosine phosphatase